nr:hypothetical protein [uncultured bacterium]
MTDSTTDQNRARTVRNQFILRKLVVQDGDQLIASHRWLWEKDRWKELVYSIVTYSSGLPDNEARLVVDQLDALGLLSVRRLAEADLSEDSEHSLLIEQITELLADSGLSSEARDKTVTALSQAATFFTNKYRGRVQAFLRQFGERLVEELRAGIGFSTLTPVEADLVLTYWLQNILELPLSLKDESVAEFASKHGMDIEEYIETADSMGLSVGFLDDLVNYQGRKKASLGGR